jgi:hypothetical protein
MQIGSAYFGERLKSLATLWRLFAVVFVVALGSALARSAPALADLPPFECTEAILGLQVQVGEEFWECEVDYTFYEEYFWEPIEDPESDFNAVQAHSNLYNDGLLQIPNQSITESPGLGLDSIGNVWSMIEGENYALPPGWLAAENLYYYSPDGVNWTLRAASGLNWNISTASTLTTPSEWGPAGGPEGTPGYESTWTFGGVYEGSAGWKGGWTYSGALPYPNNFGVGGLVARDSGKLTRPNHPSITLPPPPPTAQNLAAEDRIDALTRGR